MSEGGCCVEGSMAVVGGDVVGYGGGDWVV